MRDSCLSSYPSRCARGNNSASLEITLNLKRAAPHVNYKIPGRRPGSFCRRLRLALPAPYRSSRTRAIRSASVCNRAPPSPGLPPAHAGARRGGLAPAARRFGSAPQRTGRAENTAISRTLRRAASSNTPLSCRLVTKNSTRPPESQTDPPPHRPAEQYLSGAQRTTRAPAPGFPTARPSATQTARTAPARAAVPRPRLAVSPVPSSESPPSPLLPPARASAETARLPAVRQTSPAAPTTAIDHEDSSQSWIVASRCEIEITVLPLNCVRSNSTIASATTRPTPRSLHPAAAPPSA